MTDPAQDTAHDGHDLLPNNLVPVLMPSSCLDDPEMMGLDPPDLTSDDFPELLSSLPSTNSQFVDGPKHVIHEQNTLIAYHVTSYRSPESCSTNLTSYTSPGYRPRYIATGQNMFLSFERAEEYARLLYSEVIDFLAPDPPEECYITQTRDPKMFEFPAWVMAARIFAPRSISVAAGAQDASSHSTVLVKRPSRSFHAAYPGQRPRLPSTNQSRPGVRGNERDRKLEEIVGVIVIPMAMFIDDSVANKSGEELMIHLGLMKTDVVEEIMREFRAIMHW